MHEEKINPNAETIKIGKINRKYFIDIPYARYMLCPPVNCERD